MGWLNVNAARKQKRENSLICFLHGFSFTDTDNLRAVEEGGNIFIRL